MCYDCWRKVKLFHEFYRMVEKVHRKHLVEVIPSSPKYDTLSEASDVDEKVIGLEIQCLNFDDEGNYDEKSTNSTLNSLLEEFQDHSNGDFETDTQFTTSSIDTKDEKDSKLIDDAQALINALESTDESEKIVAKRKSGRPKQSQPKLTTKKKEKRTIEQIVCYMCKKELKTLKSLRRHLFLHDSRDTFRFKCDRCGKKYSHGNLLRKHIKQCHETDKSVLRKTLKVYRYTKCPICDVQ